MTRQRPTQKPPEEPGGEKPTEKKYSLLVPPELDAKLAEIMRKRRVKLSLLIREILSDNVESYLDEAYGRGECDEYGFSVQSPLDLTITVTPEIRALLVETARNLSLKADAVVQLLLSRHLHTLVEEGRKLRAKMRDVLGETTPPSERNAEKA